MGLPKSGNEVPKVSAEAASEYVQKLVELEQVNSGSKENAFAKVARDYGLTVSQLVHLYKRKAKKCDVSLYARVRGAYLDRCARMVAALQHEIELGGASGVDADDKDLAFRAAALAAEVATKRAALKARKQVKPGDRD